MQCSIERSVAVSHPTCVDYSALGHPGVGADLLTELSRFYPRSIGEDEAMGRVHVLDTLGSRVIVLSYEGRKLFEYTLKGLDQFKPRGMCIRNNLVYVTDLRYHRLYLFTTEGELVSYVGTNHCKPSEGSKRRPRGVAADRENNVYVCYMEELQVFNCTLPVFQTYGRKQIGKPKDVQLFEESILVLSWDPGSTVFVLSTRGSVLHRIVFGTNSTNRPWYFDVDTYGNILMAFSRDSVGMIELRSQEGKLIASQQLEGLSRPRGIKLLKNKTMLAVTSYGKIPLTIF